MSIFIFSWNTQAKKFEDITFLKNLIIDNSHDLLIIALQEDTMRTNTLIEKFSEYLQEYTLLDTMELSGWGVATVKSLVYNWEYNPRGLRLAVFKNKNSKIEITKIFTNKFICPSFQYWFTHGKGSISINISTNYGNFSFINLHLPFASSSLINGKRHKSLLWQSYCLSEIYKFHTTIDYFKADYIFISGDFNFRLQNGMTDSTNELVTSIFKFNNEYLQELYNNADELKVLLSYSDVYSQLLEGVDNMGPQFYPTCKLKHYRKDIQIEKQGVYKLGKYNQRIPSWCDRILYCFPESRPKGFNKNIKCVEYNRFDNSDMSLSDHASIYAIFVINN